PFCLLDSRGTSGKTIMQANAPLALLPPLSREQLDRIVQALRSLYPGWESFDDPRFIEDEITYKKEAIAKAADQLSAPELRRLLDERQFEEILKRVENIGRTNLLFHGVPRAGDLGILYQPDLNKEGFCAALVDLLHGEGHSRDRFGRYVDWVASAGLPNKWTFPTYFLFMCHPETEIFIKPGVTAGFLDLLGFQEEFRDRPPSSSWYATIRGLAHQLRDAFAHRRAKDMVDIQSAIFIAGQKGGTRYWKISPEEGARLWEDWREGGHASIGWEKLGDVSELTRAQFDSKRKAIEQEDKSYSSRGAGQVWTFSRIREGDQIVANRGMSEVVGIGTVTGPYTFIPGVVHGHRLPVHWTDLRSRKVRKSWNKTLLPLSREEFQEIVIMTPSRSFEDLRAALRSKGLYFPAEVVSNYLLALQTKRFVIITGISGTGKTQLALGVAKFFNSTAADNHVVEAVRPDWTDHRGLLGYFNPLTGRYVSTPFLDLVLRASEEERKAGEEGRDPHPFFAILDEMNLARVEHYFSDFLSALESGEPLRLHDEEGVSVPRSLEVPPNLFFTGTVNVDESTYMFSPKVLDRAFTLELNEVHLDGLSSLDSPGDGLRLDRFPGPLLFEEPPSSKHWELLDAESKRIVKGLNVLLAEENRHFGYRVATEISRFVTLAAEQADGVEARHAALDLALLQKVLPKLHGTQQELEELLKKLLEFGSGLPRFRAKIDRMLRRLERQGFTSFIE
ncbi:MAG TPA: hypothetical protein VI669_15825, partial [Vicinamibacteria bacterium]